MKPAARRKARKLAVQAIYSWQLSQNSFSDIEAQFLTDTDTDKVDVDYFLELVRGVGGHYRSLDESLKPFLALQKCHQAVGCANHSLMDPFEPS